VLQLLARLEQVLLAFIIIAMVVLFAGSVLIREVSDDLFRRIDWVDEATRYLMVWMVFLGLGLALARGKHIAMTSYLDRFPDGPRRLVRRLIDAVGLLFSLYIVWFGMDITLLVLGTGQASPTLGFTTAVLYLALPVGFALLALRYLASLFSITDRWLADDDSPGVGH
jgi:C4-dicarboxylate transporter DctQ subunit